MSVRNFRDSLLRFLALSKRKDQSNSTPELTEQGRLIHRLSCIDLDEEEAKCLQGYLTTILEARHQDKSSNVAPSPQSGCIVLEMGDEDFQEFVHYVGGNGVRLFRALVQSDNCGTPTRKLTIVGEHGLRLFHVLVQGRDSLLQN